MPPPDGQSADRPPRRALALDTLTAWLERRRAQAIQEANELSNLLGMPRVIVDGRGERRRGRDEGDGGRR